MLLHSNQLITVKEEVMDATERCNRASHLAREGTWTGPQRSEASGMSRRYIKQEGKGGKVVPRLRKLIYRGENEHTFPRTKHSRQEGGK